MKPNGPGKHPVAAWAILRMLLVCAWSCPGCATRIDVPKVDLFASWNFPVEGQLASISVADLSEAVNEACRGLRESMSSEKILRVRIIDRNEVQADTKLVGHFGGSGSYVNVKRVHGHWRFEARVEVIG